MKKVAENREKKSSGPIFKPSRPQEFKGYYNPDEPFPVPTGTINIEPDKKRFIHAWKVHTEKRGIFTNHSKIGKIPNEYFSYPVRDIHLIILIEMELKH